MKIISIASWKGGVGKTTITYNLGQELANQNKEILFIDLDPQGNLTQTFDLKVENTILSKQNLISKTKYKNIDLIASDIDLINPNINEKVNIKFILNNIQNQKKYDYCLIDTAPNFNSLIQKAMINSNSVYLISDVSQYSLNGVSLTYKNYEQFCNQNNIKNNINGIIISQFRNTKLSKIFIKELEKSKFKKLLIKPYIPQWESFRKVGIFRKNLEELNEKKANVIIKELVNNYN